MFTFDEAAYESSLIELFRNMVYQYAYGRRDIALRFNKMVRDGEIGPVMLGRDHHDTGGTDS